MILLISIETLAETEFEAGHNHESRIITSDQPKFVVFPVPVSVQVSFRFGFWFNIA